jgi:hypothetical protein
MRYLVEVQTESQPAQAPNWVLLTTHESTQPAIAAAAYEAAKNRYRRVRLRRADGQVLADSGCPHHTPEAARQASGISG